jgi:hypothetical protein
VVVGDVLLQDLKPTPHMPYLTSFDKANVSRGYCSYLPKDEVGFCRYWNYVSGVDATAGPLLMPTNIGESSSCLPSSKATVQSPPQPMTRRDCVEDLWESDIGPGTALAAKSLPKPGNSLRCEVRTPSGPHVVPLAALSK